MTTSPSPVTLEAARWFMELQSADAAERKAFARWLLRSPEHIEEFLAVSSLSCKLDDAAALRKIDVDLQSVCDTADIIPMRPPTTTHAAHRRKPRRMSTLLTLAASVAALSMAAGWLWIFMHTYGTGTGEQRTLKLADRSVVQLNTRSKVRIYFSAERRDVELIAGEALFTIERDPRRPFRVLTDTAVVQALGTQFNVYRVSKTKTTVAVMEGAVQISKNADDARAPVRLDAGEQVGIDAARVEKRSADVQDVTAWRERRLIFRDKPLAEIVAEFNRYNDVQFEVDAEVGGEPLSGVFAADRPEAFALFLEKDAALKVERKARRIVIRAEAERTSP